MNNEDISKAYDVEKAFEYHKWMKEIPFIKFPSDWEIKLSPPFGAKVVRFRVRLPGMKEGDSISVYLDCYDTGGCVGQPYWEVYPYQGDCGRCFLNETDELIKMIADRSTGLEPAKEGKREQSE